MLLQEVVRIQRVRPIPVRRRGGGLARLTDVIEFYDRGGRPNPNLDADIRPLQLTAGEKSALMAFLRSLSGTVVE